jgi:hypothetical protein
VLEVRWLDPKTIELQYDRITGKLNGFVRRLNGYIRQEYQYNDETRMAPGLAWVWTPGMNETGPGDNLAEACKQPATILTLGDSVVKGLFERGAINAYWISAETMPVEEERQRIVDKLKRTLFGGADKSSGVEVFSSGLTPTKIGTDPKDLELGAIAARLQTDMCAVSETPALLLHPTEASNRSVIDRATQNWITTTIKPHAQMVVDALNFHVLEPAGYTLELNTAAMDVDQEEEASKAAAWALYVDRGVDPETAAAMLGIDIPSGLPFVVEQPQPQPAALPVPADTSTEAALPADERKAAELARLGKFIENGTYLVRSFKSDILTPAEIEAAVIHKEWQAYP